MKKYFILLLWVLLIVSEAKTQNLISGSVAAETGEELFFATLVLRTVDEKKMVGATTSDQQGNFSIDKIQDGTYYLEVSMLGYQKLISQQFSFPRDNERKVSLQLVPDVETLTEVTVTAQVPLMEQRADRIIVNVENSLIGSSGSFLDALQSVPGVIRTHRGIQMAGQSSLTILINGKSTRYMDLQTLLQSLPASNIKQIEVIHQPGAEFEASGIGPILNIILKKNNLLGTNGSASIGLVKDYRWVTKNSVSLSHYQGKVNLGGFMGYFQNARQGTIDIERNVQGDLYRQHSENPNDGNTFGSRFNLDWALSPKVNIGLVSEYWAGQNDQIQNSTTSIDFGDPTVDGLSIQTGNVKDASWYNYAFNPYFSQEFKNRHHRLEVDFNFFRNQRDDLNELIIDDIINPQNSIFGQRFDQFGTTRIEAFKVDYHQPLTKSIGLETGLKYSRAELDNDLGFFEESENEIWQNSIERSNRYRFNELINAAYLKFNLQKKHFSGTFGLRYEQSLSEGISVTQGETLERKIAKLFPSFSLQQRIAGPIALSLAYSYRIERPGYNNLNPFTLNLDPYTSVRGNPVLIPSLTHSYRAGLLFQHQPFFTMEYKVINDPMVEVTEQDDQTGQTFLNTVNLDKQKIFNAQLLFPLKMGKTTSGYGGINVNHNKYESNFLEQTFDASRWTYTVFLQANVKLPKDFSLEFGGSYNSGILKGLIWIDQFYTTQFSIGKKLWDDRARFTLGLSDVFNTFIEGGIQYANMDIDFVESWFVPRLRMQFSYKFGNRFLKKKRVRDMGAKEEIKRTSS